jgi:hypothetical protein
MPIRSRTLMILIFGMLVGMGITPLMAQENWSALFYQGEDETLIRVSIDGTQQTYSLDVSPNKVIHSSNMAITKSGERIAFCSSQQDQTDPILDQSAELIVREIAAETVLFTLPVQDCLFGDTAFSPDERYLFISHLNQEVASTDPLWNIRILDAETGEVFHELNSTSSITAPFDVLRENKVIVLIRQITDHQVMFMTFPVASLENEWVGYTWDWEANSLTSTPFWSRDGIDTLPGAGETAFVDVDENLPPEPLGRLRGSYENNVVKVIDSTGNERTIFHTPDWRANSVRYIDDGARLAIHLIPPYEPTPVSPPLQPKWIALDRTGEITELGDIQSLVAAPGGYITWPFSYDPQTTGSTISMNFTYHADGQSREFFTVEGLGMASSLDLLWITPSIIPDDLSPFPTISG